MKANWKISVVLLILSVIACGVQTTLSQAVKSVDILRQGRNTYIETNIPSRLMTVCESGGLYIRAKADPSADIVGELADGDTVTVEGTRVVADDMGLWWKIDGGYVNARFLCEGK